MSENNDTEPIASQVWTIQADGIAIGHLLGADKSRQSAIHLTNPDELDDDLLGVILSVQSAIQKRLNMADDSGGMFIFDASRPESIVLLEHVLSRRANRLVTLSAS